MGKRVAVRVPATTANLGPGFDALGMALNLYNTVELEETGGPGFHVEVTGQGAGVLPRNAENLVARAIDRVFRRVNADLRGWKLRLENRIPLQRGLGSSAAAIVGGLLVANAVAGNPLSGEELLSEAIAVEGHPDNVAAALLGGVVAVAEQGGRYYYANFAPPRDLVIYAVIPSFTLSTKAARSVLPELLPRKDVVFNLGRVALLISALKDGDWDLLRVALGDRLHQPYRARLIPGMEEAFAAAEKSGAYGAVLSGAGPTLIAFGPPALEVGRAMERALAANGIEAEVRELEPSSRGAYIID